MSRIKQLEESELSFLRNKIEAKFLADNLHIQTLKKNSYKESYDELQVHMRKAVPDRKNSFGLSRLRKLYYYTDAQKHHPPEKPHFGIDFLDACYLYISDQEYDRNNFLYRQNQKASVAKQYLKIAHFNPPLLVSMIFMAAFLFIVCPREIVWLFGMKYTWWVCEYDDGTRVYNYFRSYKTYDEVKDYFMGNTRGDCDAFILDEEGKKHHICYDSHSARKHLAVHGDIIAVRLDDPGQ